MTKNIGKLTVFLIPIGVAINIVGYQLFYVLLKTPFAVDAIGTIVVGALCGPVAGAIVGLVTNLVNSISNPTSMFYAILSVGFGIAAGFLARKNWFSSIKKSLIVSFVFSVIGGIGSVFISWVVYGFDFGTGMSTLLVAIPLYEHGVPKFLAQLISSFGFDIPDKLITCFIVFLILSALPLRFLTKLPQGKYFIKESADE